MHYLTSCPKKKSPKEGGPHANFFQRFPSLCNRRSAKTFPSIGRNKGSRKSPRVQRWPLTRPNHSQSFSPASVSFTLRNIVDFAIQDRGH